MPNFRGTLTHARSVDYEPLGIEGYFGGLNGHVEVGQQVPLGHGYRPGVPSLHSKLFKNLYVMGGKYSHRVKVHLIGILRVNFLQSLQLSNTDASSGGPEEEEGGTPLVHLAGGGDGRAVKKSQGEFRNVLADLGANLNLL